MNASSTFEKQRPHARREVIAVPARWRAGQFVALALIALTAIYYFTTGWKSAAIPRPSDNVSPFDGMGFVILAALVWLTTPAAGVIAMTTFQESLRRRWMGVMVAFGVVVLALSTFFSGFSPGAEEQFLRDFGLGFIIIMTMLMAIFLGVSLVPPDIERRTIFTILSKPVTRLEFLIGKFLGLCLTLLVSLVILSAMFLVVYTVFQINKLGYAVSMQSEPEVRQTLGFNLINLAKALSLQFGQLTILAALSLMLSLVVSNITAIVFCFVLYFGGQMSAFFEHLNHGHGDENSAGPNAVGGLSASIQAVIGMMTFLLPKLDRFDVRERVVTELPVYFNYMWKAMGSGLVYVAVLLVVAYMIFEDREF